MLRFGKPKHRSAKPLHQIAKPKQQTGKLKHQIAKPEQRFGKLKHRKANPKQPIANLVLRVGNRLVAGGRRWFPAKNSRLVAAATGLARNFKHAPPRFGVSPLF